MSQLMNGSNQEHQVLTRIKGIGPVKQRWLRETLKINTIRDLAILSIEQIESRLKAKGQTFSHSEIKGWIEQAQQLIDTEPSAQEILDSSRLTNNSKSPQLTQEIENVEENSSWQSFASFKVEFQSRKLEGNIEEQRTVINYLEADKSQFWFGTNPEEMPQWMLEQMRKEIPQTTAHKNLSLSHASIEITQILAFQPPQSERAMVVDQSNRLFQSTINSGEPFMLVVVFKIDGLEEANLNKQNITYQAQFHGRNRTTGTVIHLGDTKPETLEKGLSFYTTRLSEISLETGIYRLQGLVKLQGAIANPGCFEIPLLQVV